MTSATLAAFLPTHQRVLGRARTLCLIGATTFALSACSSAGSAGAGGGAGTRAGGGGSAGGRAGGAAGGAGAKGGAGGGGAAASGGAEGTAAAAGGAGAKGGAGGAGGATGSAGVGGTAGAAGGSGGLGGASGSLGGAVGGAGGLAGTAGVWKTGSLYMESAPDPPRSPTATSIGGDFMEYASQDDNCTHESHGPCELAICGTPPNPLGYFGAGTVTFSSDAMTAQMNRLINGTYQFVYVPGDLWSRAGSTITVSAPGGDVPAFSAQMAAPAVLSFPASSSSALALATRGKDIAVTWQGGGPCQATFEFYVRQDYTTYDAICSFPSPDDSATIPAAALAPFPSGLRPTYTFRCIVTTDLTVSDWAIRVRAITDARNPDGTISEGGLSSW